MKRLLLPLLLLALGFAACRKDSLNTNTTTTSPIPTEYTKAQIYGVVIDAGEKPIPDAQVELHTQTGKLTLTTDKNGAYLFPQSTINAKGTYIKVSHPAYFHGSKVVNVRPNSRNQVVIQLLSNTATKTISSATGGTADYGDYSLALPANAVTYANGQAYSGTVHVAAHYLKPAENGFSRLAPGRLEGLTTTGDVTGLISLGQMAVELRADNGDLLQIKTGQEATLRIKVPASSLSFAPKTIPMWWFDEQAGIWKEEGNSELSNGWYEGKVKHFTFWNWDFTNPSVTIDFKFVDTNGNPVTNIYFDVQATVQHTHGSGSPDADGHLIGNVPANEPLVLYVYAQGGGCNLAPLVTQNIGPFNAPTQVCITVPASPSVHNYTVSGTLLDCNGQPVTNGYVRSTGGQYGIYPVNAQGEYSVSWSVCAAAPTAVTLYGFDSDALKESDPLVVPLTTNTVTAPPLTTCQNASSFLILNTSAGTYNYLDVQAAKDSSVTATHFYLSAVSQLSTNPRVSFDADVINGLTDYQPSTFQVIDISTPGTTSGFGCDGDCNNMIITITENGGSGGYLAGTFTGTLPNQIGTPPFNNNFSGSFRARIW